MRLFLKLYLLLFVYVVQAQISFQEEALADVFLTESSEEIAFSEVLKKYKGKTILIDVWATWCRDCIKGMPKVKALQETNAAVVFLFLSLDRDTATWKKGIARYKLEGEHYFVSSGWKGAFGSSINLDWIPRYMIVNPEGEISLYKAIKADDENIKNTLR